MALFKSSRPVFRSVADALGLLEADAATTEYESGPVKPRLDVQASLEAVVNYSEFVLGRTDGAGGTDTTVDVDVHVLGDWDEIRRRNVTFVGVAGTEVPAAHDAWIIRVGVSATVPSNFETATLFTLSPTVVAGDANVPLFHADTVIVGELLARGAALDSPIILPLPWWVPPVNDQLGSLKFRLNTSNAVSTNLVLGVLSAPRGTFRRLY